MRQLMWVEDRTASELRSTAKPRLLNLPTYLCLTYIGVARSIPVLSLNPSQQNAQQESPSSKLPSRKSLKWRH